MAELRVRGWDAKRLSEFVADHNIPATVEDRGAEGLWLVAADGADTTVAEQYGDEYVPAWIATHLPHLRDYLTADPTTITNAQTVHVVRDLIRAVRYLNRRLE